MITSANEMLQQYAGAYILLSTLRVRVLYTIYALYPRTSTPAHGQPTCIAPVSAIRSNAHTTRRVRGSRTPDMRVIIQKSEEAAASSARYTHECQFIEPQTLSFMRQNLRRGGSQWYILECDCTQFFSILSP